MTNSFTIDCLIHSGDCLIYSGDCLPIRLFLSSYRLTPTMRNIEERFTIKYYLNLVITDEEDNKYFKQQVRLLIGWSQIIGTATVRTARVWTLPTFGNPTWWDPRNIVKRSINSLQLGPYYLFNPCGAQTALNFHISDNNNRPI